MKKIISILLMAISLTSFGKVYYDTSEYEKNKIVAFNDRESQLNGLMIFDLEDEYALQVLRNLEDDLFEKSYRFYMSEGDLSLYTYGPEDKPFKLAYLGKLENNVIIVYDYDEDIPDETFMDILEKLKENDFARKRRY